MRVSLAALGFVVALAPMVALAGDEGDALTLEQVLAMGMAQSPLVRRAVAERELAEAGRVGARVLQQTNPWLAGSVGVRQDRSGSLPPANGLEWTIRLELPIEIAGQRGARLREVDRFVEVARRREAFARTEARARLTTLFVGMQLVQEAADTAREFEQLGERLLASARARAAAGASSDVEVRLAEAELGRLRHQRMEAELITLQTRGELRQWLALAPGSPVRVAKVALPPAEIDGSLAALVARAQAARHDLQALIATGSAFDAQLVRLRREVVPNPVLAFDAAQQQPGQTYLGGGLGLTLPIFARNQGPIAIARAESARAAVEVELQSRQIALEIGTLFEVLRLRRSELDLWQDQILPAARASAELVETGWRAGKFDLFRVLQIQREANEARRKRLEVLGELWAATISLLRSVGTQ